MAYFSAPQSHFVISPIDEQFISQICMSPSPLEQSLANVLKAIYAAGRAEVFQDVLKCWAESREAEIERACLEGYAQFVPTVDVIMGSVKNEGKDLEQKLESLHNGLISSAQNIHDTRVERYEARKLLLNVGRGIHKLESALKVLELLQKIRLEITDGNFQVAVRLLEDLREHPEFGLHSISDLPIYEPVKKTVDALSTKLWESGMGKVKAWLGKMRDDSMVMGRLALSQVQTRYEQFERIVGETTGSGHSSSEMDSFEIYLLEHGADDLAAITTNDLVKIDFGPLQDALRLAALMDRTDDFEQLFIETRRIQADLLLQSSKVIFERPDTDPRSLRSFLSATAGFFLVERALIRMPSSFYPIVQIERHWDAAIKKLDALALNSLKLSSSDRSAFMKLKWQFIFFAHLAGTLLMLPSSALKDSIYTMFYRYIDLLRAEAEEAMLIAVKTDPLAQLALTPELMNMFPKLLGKLNDDQLLSLPLSRSVYDGFILIRQFISSYGVFLEGVPGAVHHQSDFAALVRRTVDLQLLPRLAKAYERRAADVDVADVASKLQILKNLSIWAEMCDCGGDLVNLIMVSDGQKGGTAMQAADAFRSTLKVAQASIMSAVEGSIDELLDKLRYDPTAKHQSSAPSAPISELVRLLKSTLGSTSSLGLDTVWINILQHVSDYYDQRVFVNVKYPSINQNFFQHIIVDLEHIQSFVQSVSSGGDSSLLEPLSAPIEICTLMAAESVHEYLDPVLRRRKYSHLDTTRLIPVLERVKEPDEKRCSVEDLILLLK